MDSGPLQFKFSTGHLSPSESLTFSGNNDIKNIFHSFERFHKCTMKFL